LELVIQPPARYPDLFPVLNVLVSTPVFGLVWLWSIKSGVEVGWAVVGLGGGNPGAAHASTNQQSIPSSSTTNLTGGTSPKLSHSHLTHRGDAGSPFSIREPSLSPLSSFNRRIGSPLATLGPHRPGVRERTWSSASANSNAKTRSNLPVGPGWERPLNLDRAERTEVGGAPLVQGLEPDLNLSGREDNRPDGKRSRGQSLGASNVRKRVSNLPGNAEGLPLPSD